MLVEFAEYDDETMHWSIHKEVHASFSAAEVRAKVKDWCIIGTDHKEVQHGKTDTKTLD